MDPSAEARDIAKKQYTNVRRSLDEFEERFIASRWDEDTMVRQGFDRFLGSLDRVAGWLFPEPDQPRQAIEKAREPDTAELVHQEAEDSDATEQIDEAPEQAEGPSATAHADEESRQDLNEPDTAEQAYADEPATVEPVLATGTDTWEQATADEPDTAEPTHAHEPDTSERAQADEPEVAAQTHADEPGPAEQVRADEPGTAEPAPVSGPDMWGQAPADEPGTAEAAPASEPDTAAPTGQAKLDEPVPTEDAAPEASEQGHVDEPDVAVQTEIDEPGSAEQTPDGTVDVAFTLPAYVEAISVALCGEFNGWSQDDILLGRDTDGTWRTTVALVPGRYRYRFLIDGERWENARKADDYVPNPYGELDCVVIVERHAKA